MPAPWKSEFWPSTFDEWRLIPRIIVAAYGYMMFDAYQWFTMLAEPTTQQVTFVTAIWSLATPMFGFYANAKPTRRE